MAELNNQAPRIRNRWWVAFMPFVGVVIGLWGNVWVLFVFLLIVMAFAVMLMWELRGFRKEYLARAAEIDRQLREIQEFKARSADFQRRGEDV